MDRLNAEACPDGKLLDIEPMHDKNLGMHSGNWVEGDQDHNSMELLRNATRAKVRGWGLRGRVCS